MTKLQDLAIESILKGEDKRFSASGMEVNPSEDNNHVEAPEKQTTFAEDAKKLFGHVVGGLAVAFNLQDSPEEAHQKAVYAERLDVAQTFLNKYKTSLESGTPLDPEDMRDVQTLYFGGHLTGSADDNTLKDASQAMDAVFEDPALFGLVNTGKGISWSEHAQGYRGYAFTAIEDVSTEAIVSVENPFPSTAAMPAL